MFIFKRGANRKMYCATGEDIGALLLVVGTEEKRECHNLCILVDWRDSANWSDYGRHASATGYYFADMSA